MHLPARNHCLHRAVTARGDAAAGSSGQPPRAGGGRDVATQAQVIAEAERLRTTYGTVPPRGAGGFDAAAQRQADLSFAWLAQAGARYRRDLRVSDALMRTYGVMGDYYNGYYPAGAWRGYVGANHWARRRWLYDERTSALQNDLDRYAQGWAASGLCERLLVLAAQRSPERTRSRGRGARHAGDRARAGPAAANRGIEADPGAEEAYREVRTQFTFISSRVHDARVLIEGLAGRLAARGLSVNSKDGATALSMQGFLVDAANLIKEHEFRAPRKRSPAPTTSATS